MGYDRLVLRNAGGDGQSPPVRALERGPVAVVELPKNVTLICIHGTADEPNVHSTIHLFLRGELVPDQYRLKLYRRSRESGGDGLMFQLQEIVL